MALAALAVLVPVSASAAVPHAIFELEAADSSIAATIGPDGIVRLTPRGGAGGFAIRGGGKTLLRGNVTLVRGETFSFCGSFSLSRTCSDG